MAPEPATRGRRRDRRGGPGVIAGAVFAALAAVGAVVYIVSQDDGRSDRAAVAAYIRDLNNGDLTRLNGDIYPARPGAAQTIINGARRPWKITNISVVHEFGPDYGVAQLRGTAAGTDLQLQLPLIRHNGAWYVAEAATQPTTADSSAATVRP